MSSETTRETNGVSYRWVDGNDATAEDWDKIEDILAARGWSSLNRPTSRILLAEHESEFAFIIFQSVPYVGPLYVPSSMRGSEVPKELANKMFKFLEEIRVRGWITTIESPFAARLCELYGMKKLDKLVYVMPYFGGLEI